MRRIEHDDTALTNSARSDIAELEHRFECRIEIAFGIAAIASVHEEGDVIGFEQADDPYVGIVSDSEGFIASRPPVNGGGHGNCVWHANVFMARLRFYNGMATSLLCPAPTAEACVAFIVAMSDMPLWADLWRAQAVQS